MLDFYFCVSMLYDYFDMVYCIMIIHCLLFVKINRCITYFYFLLLAQRKGTHAISQAAKCTDFSGISKIERGKNEKVKSKRDRIHVNDKLNMEFQYTNIFVSV